MICAHRSIKARHTGQQDTCILCRLPIIFDGQNWHWAKSLAPHKFRKLTQIYAVDEMTGAHRA